MTPITADFRDFRYGVDMSVVYGVLYKATRNWGPVRGSCPQIIGQLLEAQ